MKIPYYFFIAFFIYYVCPAQNGDTFKKQLEEIENLRTLTKSSEYTIEDRIKYAQEAVKLSKLTNVDTVLLKSNRILSMLYLGFGDYNQYKNKYTCVLVSQVNIAVII